VNSIEKHVLQLIGENTTSPDVFADTDAGMVQIRDSVNDAIEEIALLTDSYRGQYIIPLRDSRSFYRLNSSRGRFCHITDAWIPSLKRRLDQTDLVRLNYLNTNWLSDSGTPECYFPIGVNWMGLWPYPTDDQIVLELMTIMIPDRYTSDTARIRLKDDFSWAAAHYAVGEYWASRGDAKSAMWHHNKYLDKMGLFKTYTASPEKLAYYRSNKERMPNNELVRS
jgi:hypothetical protein